MSKYIEIASGKMIGAFAGVGALVENTESVVKVKPIDQWEFFKTNIIDEEKYQINDGRLLQRLKYDKSFSKLKALVKVPTDIQKNTTQYIQPTNYEMAATSEYFPKWMFCNRCYRFKHLEKWFLKWKEVKEQYDKSSKNNYFTLPKCGYCYEEAKIKKLKYDMYQNLIQVRFILTSSDGKIKDIPWHKWTTFKKQTKKEDKIIDYDKWKQCCDNQDLYYKINNFEDLAGIGIQCKGCEKKSTLTGLYSLNYFSDKAKKHRYKTVIRSSNSVYYPMLVHSLYLPSETNISSTDQSKIDGWLNKNKQINFIFEALEEKYKKSTIQDYIDKKNKTGFQKELVYRKKEYQFILENKNYEKDNFTFNHQEGNLTAYGISHLVQISRLKMTTVQTGYTRQQPLDIDLFLDNEIDTIKPKYTSTKGNKTEYLLGMENFGEGIFISFNTNIAQKYIENNKIKIEKVLERSQKSALFKKHFNNINYLAKFITIHTMSHLLMKELEFSCGYPTVSLKERLFIDDKQMQGVLIYTVGGEEGSFGGLSSQAQSSKKFKTLLKNALDRAEDCASDPICYHSEGQGVGELNLAACYSCALISDNACEVFNSFLDRTSTKK